MTDGVRSILSPAINQQDVKALIYACQIVPVMKDLSFVMVLMVASIPMDMDIATTTTLALGSKDMAGMAS